MNATHANIEATPGPTFGGGYRVRIMAGKKQIATQHFAVPPTHRNLEMLIEGIGKAYADAKQYCATFGVE